MSANNSTYPLSQVRTAARKSSASSTEHSPRNTSGATSESTSRNTSLDNLIRGNHEHNFRVLDHLANTDENYLVLLNISKADVDRGQAGKIYSCAASESAKEHFGRGCQATVKEDARGRTVLGVSDRKHRSRYEMVLGIFETPGAFDPERYDEEGRLDLPSQGGSVLIQNVRVGPMPVDKRPLDSDTRKNRRSASERETRKPRKWTSVGLKDKTRATKTKTKTVVDVLTGEASTPYTDIFRR